MTTHDDPATLDIDELLHRYTAAQAMIAKLQVWLTEETVRKSALREQLATAHDAIGAARALLNQGQISAARLLLDDAAQGRTR